MCEFKQACSVSQNSQSPARVYWARQHYTDSRTAASISCVVSRSWLESELVPCLSTTTSSVNDDCARARTAEYKNIMDNYLTTFCGKLLKTLGEFLYLCPSTAGYTQRANYDFTVVVLLSCCPVPASRRPEHAPHAVESVPVLTWTRP